MTGEKYADWSEPMVYMPRQEFDKLRDSIPWQSGPVPADAEPGLWLVRWADERVELLPVRLVDGAKCLLYLNGAAVRLPAGTHCCRLTLPEDKDA